MVVEFKEPAGRGDEGTCVDDEQLERPAQCLKERWDRADDAGRDGEGQQKLFSCCISSCFSGACTVQDVFPMLADAPEFAARSRKLLSFHSRVHLGCLLCLAQALPELLVLSCLFLNYSTCRPPPLFFLFARLLPSLSPVSRGTERVLPLTCA